MAIAIPEVPTPDPSLNTRSSISFLISSDISQSPPRLSVASAGVTEPASATLPLSSASTHAIASCGMVGGLELHTTVMPFIIRGIGLLGVNSSGCRYPLREQLWQKLANEWKPSALQQIGQSETDLNGLPQVFDRMLAGQSFGRCLVVY